MYFAVAEFQAVHRLEVSTQLATVLIEEDVQAGTRVDAHVVVALRADIQGLFQLRTVQHGFAGRAFVHRPSGTELFWDSERMMEGISLSTSQLLMLFVLQCSRDGRTDPVTASLSNSSS